MQGLIDLQHKKAARVAAFFMRNRLVTVGLIGLFLGWNLPNHYPPWPAYHLELASAVALIVLFFAVAWPWTGAGNRRPISAQGTGPVVAVPLPTAARAVLLLAAVPPLQYGAGLLQFRGDALLGSLYALGLAMSIYVGHLWATQQGRQQAIGMLFLAIVWGAIAANALALTQWLRLDAPGWWANALIDARPFANFSQPNHYGLLMVLGLLGGAALFELGLVRSRPVLYLLAGYFGGGVVLSQSRAAALALLSLAFCWLWTRMRVASRLRLAEVLPALVLWLLLYLALESIQTAMLLQQDQFKQPLQAGVRPWMWSLFGTAVLGRPWFGFGFNQGVEALATVATLSAPAGVTVATTFAHNFALDLMVWAGLPCTLLVLLALGWWLVGWLRHDADPRTAAQRHLVFAAWLALLVQSLFEYPYAYAYFLLPAGLLAGTITCGRAPRQPPPTVARYTCSPIALALGVAGSVLLGALAADYWRLEDDFRMIRFVRANYVNQPPHDYLEQPLVLDQLALLNSTARYPVGTGMSERQLDSMRAMARRYQNTVVQLDYARALALNGKLELAQRELVLIRSLYDASAYRQVEQQWQQWLAQQPGMPVPAR